MSNFERPSLDSFGIHTPRQWARGIALGADRRDLYAQIRSGIFGEGKLAR
jgi:hypothetical protein